MKIIVIFKVYLFFIFPQFESRVAPTGGSVENSVAMEGNLNQLKFCLINKYTYFDSYQ